MKNLTDTYYRYTSINLEKLKPLVEKYDSPAFIYSINEITKSYDDLRKGLPNAFKVFYAQKSNPNERILNHINKLGAGCDAASIGEMKSALKAGFTPDKIMFTGPSKTIEEISFAIENNLMSINVESIQELTLVDEIACKAGKRQNILVRLNPLYDSSESIQIIGGTGVSKFGIDIEQAEDFFNVLKSCKNVFLNGIHVFNSSQILDAERILENTKNVIDTAQEFSKSHFCEIKTIDFGGGFGIPYSDDEEPLNIEKLSNGLKKLISEGKNKLFLGGVDLIFEPGRYLSGRAGLYLVKVLYTKNSRGKEILLIDGGIHHLLRQVLVGQQHTAINLSALFEERKNKHKYMIAGPLCTSLDTLGEDVELAESRRGDIIAFFNAGAYGYTESMPLFLSHTPAKEIFLD